MRKTLLFCLLLASCASAPAQTTDATLPPYLTGTPAATSTPNVLPPDTPIPTSTMQVYIIEEGDTLSEIAEKFKIPQADLIAANPDVNPNALPIGGTLFIPDPSAPSAAASTPHPSLFPVTRRLLPHSGPGNWCFALIQNNTPNPLENVSAQITLLDETNNAITSQTAYLPLDIIQPNEALPVFAFFPNTPANVNSQIQLLSAAQGDGSRYLPASLDNTSAEINWDGRTATLSGQIHLPAESNAA
ncbi:MAG: LysM peptidoglycan-binding domain-containing protein, partial [Anaerolineales bacterium]|nr:LysM peptidoglycan-binding domain-containing protein [Anaerolineales bacterium]